MVLLLDENIPARWRDVLTAAGYTTHHWLDIGEAGATDDCVLEEAQRLGAVIITQDLDFGKLLAQTNSQLPSVLQLRVASPIPEVCAQEVLYILNAYAKELNLGSLISYESGKHRIRLLPLKRR